MDGQLSFTDLTVNIEDIKAIEEKMEKPKTKPKGETKVAETKKGSLPVDLGNGYNRYNVVSAWHKELRKGDEEAACYWLQVLIDGGVPKWYLCNYLWSIAPEELAMEVMNSPFMGTLGHMKTHYQNVHEYHLYYAVIQFCQFKHWHECEVSKKMRNFWYENARVLKEGDDLKEIPYYTHDMHTSKGKQLMKKGEADLRYAGAVEWMEWRALAYEQHGTIDVPEDQVEWPEGRRDYMKNIDNYIK